MLGNIVKWSAVILCSMVLGWMLCIVLQDFSLFTLEWEIGMSDVLCIFIEIILACVIAQILEKNMNNTRVEKNYFINELDSVRDIFSEMERVCSKETVLSLLNTNYEIGRSRKILNRTWKMMGEVENTYQKSLAEDYNGLMKAIKIIDKQLTDTTTFKPEDGFEAIKIVRNHIYINNTVKPKLDATLSDIKEHLLRLKIKVNKK